VGTAENHTSAQKTLSSCYEQRAAAPVAEELDAIDDQQSKESTDTHVTGAVQDMYHYILFRVTHIQTVMPCIYLLG
jgi:hypothetical protein